MQAGNSGSDTNELKKRSKSIAEASGFPLQIRIADVSNSSPKWEVLLEEHLWQSIDNPSIGGAIDLVVLNSKNKVWTMVIECKRVRQVQWVFLVPQKNPRQRTHSRLWVSQRGPSKWEHFNWWDLQADPASYESKFCAIPGHEHGRLTLLERTGSDLIESIEALAWQERELNDNNPAFMRIYAPVVVTTAELRAASFEPNTISLFDGSLSEDTSFITVPYVRFRKTFTSTVTSPNQKSVQEIYSASERTIFIVNAEKWHQFLREWEITGY